MVIWDDDSTGYSPDWSADFFKAGGLAFDAEKGAYIVPDVDYCVEQAEDWRDSRGDFSSDAPNENNRVFVEEI